MSSLYDRLAKLTPEQRRQFERRMAEQGMRTRRGLEPISPRASDRAPELSFAQSRLWFVQQLDPDNAAYNAGSALRLRGALDIGALTNALNAIIRRHEALRSCFVPTANGRPEVCVQDRVEVALPLEDFSRHGEAGDSRPEAGLREAVAALMRQPFDLRELPFRFALYRLSARDHVLVLIAHHIVCDRWSVMVFMRELLAHYQASLDGLECPVDPLPIQYGDWAIWQRERLRGQRLDDLLGYWRERLRGSPAYLELPTDRALPALASNRGAQYPVVLDRALGDALKALAGRNRVTLFTLLLAVFKVLLLRYSGSDDIVVGSEVANRDRTETAGLIGLLVNTLVLRSDLSGDPEFQTLLGRVHDTVVGALEHQELPFEQLVEAMNPARSLDQLTPLFQVKFDLQQVPVSSQGLGDLSIERFPVEEQQTKYQLRFNLQEGDDGIRGQIEYSTDLFDAATIERMAGHFQNLLTAVVADPTISIAKLSLLGAGERQWLIEGCNDNVIARPDGSIHGLFARQAALTPAQTAVIDGSRTLTYRQLDEASNRVASRLRALGVGPETPVGVCMPRDHRLVIALLGVLKAGGAYVPMDPDYPARRLAYMVADAGIEFLLAGAETPELGSPSRCRVLAVDSLLREGEAVPWRATMTPSQLAYVIYTSGSTGEPKGVAIEHRNAVAMLHWAKHQYDDASLSGVLAATSVCFDLSVFEVFAPLVHGGAVVIAENLLALHRHPARDQVTLVNTVPSLLRQILDGSGLPPNVRTVNLAGEPLPASLVRRLQALPQLRFIYNLYGPSEDTTYSTAAPLDRPHFGDGAERVPIGLPVENTHAIVLDAHHEPVPVGVSGELYLGGAGLARGYLHRETLTAERFVTNPLPEAVELGWTRLYRTGDRVVRRADGSLEFLGRVDHQFKLRGLRIEAGEIEATLRKHAAIREALVVAHRGDDAIEAQLLAYVVPNGEHLPAIAALRAHLAEHLPAPMVPTLWQPLEALPRLPNGKVDHASLPSPEPSTPTPASRGPRTPTEQRLVTLWAELLGRDTVGADDDFFALGGHSLLAIEMMTRIEQALAVRLPLRTLFQAPTVATLAALLDAHATGGSGEASNDRVGQARPPIAPDPGQAHAPFPLTDIQQAYWLGRSGAFELGNVAAHGYREIDSRGLEPDRIEGALDQLIARHGMLRMVVDRDGQQRVLAEVPGYRIKQQDLASLAPSAREQALGDIRDRLSHEMLDPGCWPLFRVEAARLDEQGGWRYFVSFDVMIGDAWSLQLLGREMAGLLAGEQLAPLELGFREYVLAERAHAQSPAYERALAWWRDRLDALPAAPQLPLERAPAEIDAPRFVRRSANLDRERWRRLHDRARAAGLSASAVVLTAFIRILARWSRRHRFTLNLTLFNRHAGHPDVNRLVGDFTSSVLLAVDGAGTPDFLSMARTVQTSLWDALEHRDVSGVTVQRELARRQGSSGGALMPVVFTSTLGQPTRSLRPGGWEADVSYALSQTSQVYLDHQVSEIDGELKLNWDSIDALFPPGVLDDMFAAYTALLEALAAPGASWETSPVIAATPYLREFNAPLAARRADAGTLLHQPFFAQAAAHPDAIAVISSEGEMSYAELARRVNAMADLVRGHGAKANDLVAISLAKGWRQVVAALAVLTSGAAYVPIDPELPRARRHELLEDTRAVVVIDDSDAAPDAWPDDTVRVAVPAREDPTVGTAAPPAVQRSQDLAYLIYTSGSTGKPKGVMIDHRGALNTIADLEKRIDLRAQDRVFGLSSLSFDLSVWDLFGTLASGAALVLPDAARRQYPSHWLDCIRRHGISVWNSVPALMQLLLSELEEQDATRESGASADPLPLRLAMLSGDWIPLALPPQLGRLLPEVKLLSLGGATEASIWSISHALPHPLTLPLAVSDPSWRSVPYGRPMDGQSWYVLDESQQPCPPWVTGELHIGGAGVALGYWRRPGLSAERFIPNPLPGKANAADPVLYRTGDLGRFRPDGGIEFLGREDQQVKIRGHRIELGEIEHVLTEQDGIGAAVVNTYGEAPELVAYVVPELGADDRSPASPLEKLMLKAQRTATGTSETAGIALPAVPELSFERQSHRRFLPEPIALEEFADLLGTMSAQAIAGAPAPKYRYPSAGSLYPVALYLSVKADRVAGLPAGWYRYEPLAHRLVDVSCTLSPAATALFSASPDAAEASAFSLFLVGDLAAIEPVYGDRARDFCLLEAGYMGQLLMGHAPARELGLCPLNDPGMGQLHEALALEEKQVVLHALVGGAIDGSWSQRWMALEPEDQVSFEERLQNQLRSRLPAYMVPTRFVLLEQLPLTANGKVDRSRLPAPDAGASAAYRAPETALDRRIVELWEQVLNLPQVGMDDNFFQLGGNSLLAMQLLSGLRRLGAADVSIGELFAALTPASQAALLDGRAVDAGAAEAETVEAPAAIPRVSRSAEEGIEADVTAGLSDADVDQMLSQLLDEPRAPIDDAADPPDSSDT